MRGSSHIPFLRLVEKFDPNMLCPACEVICTADSRHCYICGQCVERYDHHCQWVNNCIGINNHSYFYLFIWLQEFYMILVVLMAFFNLDVDITQATLDLAKKTCILPIIVHEDPLLAQITFDVSLVLTLMLCLLFLPFLTQLIII